MVEVRPYTDSELLAIQPLVIEPGTTDENGVTRNRHLRNPFAPDGAVPKDAARVTLANRWSTLHWHEPEETGPAPVADPFDLLRDTLAAMDGAKLFYEPPECDGAAVHPLGISSRDPAAVEAWERAAIEMHSEQKPVTVPDKPAPQALVGRIHRTVQVVDEPAVPNFADLPESERRRLHRGD